MRIFNLLLLTSFLASLSTCSTRKSKQELPATDTVRIDLPSYKLNSAADLDLIIQQIGGARVVLLGEASHGTSEYYRWRAAISKRLITEKGFDFIAVEGEWADSYRVNQFVKGGSKDSAATIDLLKQYNRWPTWMWSNYEVAGLVHWMNQFNQGKATEDKVGFFGLDVYCLWESMGELMPILPEDRTLRTSASKVQQCFRPFSADAYAYATAVANEDASCREQTHQLWEKVQRGVPKVSAETEFLIQQNSLVAYNGERYYRTMTFDNAESWNIRDRHMSQTLKRLLEFHGKDSKAIVWEHNTHVGDAQYTEMSQSGETNVGELVRKEYGRENVFIVGFGSYTGTVIASTEWGGAIQRMDMPEAVEGSWEHMLHQLGGNRVVLSKDLRNNAPMNQWIGHRAIGVVYHANREQYGNYVQSVIPQRYDAFVFIDRTTALHPIGTRFNDKEPPDTYPWGY
jgi:erythromycin esterase